MDLPYMNGLILGYESRKEHSHMKNLQQGVQNKHLTIHPIRNCKGRSHRPNHIKVAF